MKKKLLFTVFTVLMSMSLYAKSSIKVICGDLSVIKESDITASVIFDYTDLKIEGRPYMQHLKSRGSDFVRDWPSESLTSESYFIKCWNHDNEDGLQVTSTAGKEYKMIFVVSDMDMGSGAASMLVGFGAGGATMSAIMHIIKGDSNVPVLTVEIDGQSGRSGMTELVRRTDLYGELAEDLAETLQKTKSSKVPPSTKAVSIPALNLGTSNGEVSQQTLTDVPVTMISSNNDIERRDFSASSNRIIKATPTVENSQSERTKILLKAKGEDIPRRRKPILGDFETIAGEKNIGLYLDFSDAEIMNRSEESFVRYMKTSAGRRDLDEDFPETWENDIKPELLSLFSAKVNEELKDEDLRLRLSSGIDFDYVLKLDVLEVDEDGNNIINFLFVNMATGKLDAQIKCESDGGHVGRFVGLIEQGFESAAENFAKILIDQID